MQTTTVIRVADDARPLNASNEFVEDDRKFVGIVREVRAFGKTHVSVRIELSDAEHRRLVLGG